MIVTKFENKSIEVEKVLICDVCKSEIEPSDEVQRQEVWHFYETGGYGSVFGDGVEMNLDMCQHCVEKILGEYIRFT